MSHHQLLIRCTIFLVVIFGFQGAQALPCPALSGSFQCQSNEGANNGYLFLKVQNLENSSGAVIDMSFFSERTQKANFILDATNRKTVFIWETFNGRQYTEQINYKGYCGENNMIIYYYEPYYSEEEKILEFSKNDLGLKFRFTDDDESVQYDCALKEGFSYSTIR